MRLHVHMCVHVSAQQSLGMHKAIDSYIGPPLDNKIGDLSFCSILKASIQLIVMTRLFLFTAGLFEGPSWSASRDGEHYSEPL